MALQPCDHCGSFDIEHDTGLASDICVNCGHVLEDNIVRIEVQHTAEGECLGVNLSARDDGCNAAFRSMVIPAGYKHHARAYFQTSKNKERKTRKKLAEMASFLKVPKLVVQDAESLLIKVMEGHSGTGSWAPVLAGSCLYASARLANLPLTLSQIAASLEVPLHDVGRSLTGLCQHLGISLPPVDPHAFVKLAAVALPEPLQDERRHREAVGLAGRLLRVAESTGLLTGRPPRPVVVAAVVLAAEALAEPADAVEVANALQVTEIKMRARRLELLRELRGLGQALPWVAGMSDKALVSSAVTLLDQIDEVSSIARGGAGTGGGGSGGDRAVHAKTPRIGAGAESGPGRAGAGAAAGEGARGGKWPRLGDQGALASFGRPQARVAPFQQPLAPSSASAAAEPGWPGRKDDRASCFGRPQARLAPPGEQPPGRPAASSSLSAIDSETTASPSAGGHARSMPARGREGTSSLADPSVGRGLPPCFIAAREERRKREEKIARAKERIARGAAAWAACMGSNSARDRKRLRDGSSASGGGGGGVGAGSDPRGSRHLARAGEESVDTAEVRGYTPPPALPGADAPPLDEEDLEIERLLLRGEAEEVLAQGFREGHSRGGGEAAGHPGRAALSEEEELRQYIRSPEEIQFLQTLERTSGPGRREGRA